MKTFLITGGAGFIGSHFADFIMNEADSRVIVLDKLTYAGNMDNLAGFASAPKHEFIEGDICDRELVAGIINDHDVDVIVNFAAESHVDRSIEDSAPFIQTNYNGVHVLLESALEAWGGSGSFDGKLFLQVSTDEVYGPLKEDVYADETFPLKPGNPYAAAKAAADLLALSYLNTYGLPVIITRCCNNFGPRQYPEKLIPLMIRNMMTGRKLPVYGDGLQEREWIYVKDHCRGLMEVVGKGHPGEIYNIGTGVSMTNIDLVTKLIGIYSDLNGRKLADCIEFVKDRKGHDRRYGLDCSKICELIDGDIAGKFEEQLLHTFRWFKERYE